MFGKKPVKPAPSEPVKPERILHVETEADGKVGIPDGAKPSGVCAVCGNPKLKICAACGN